MGDTAAQGGVRRLFLALVLAGMLGLAAELVLLEHVESVWQWVPLAALALGFIAGIVALLRPARGSLRAFQAAMAIFVAAGVLGIYLHYRGNTEFELESDPALGGWTLFRLAMQGATPALAPGALAQLGLVALLATYRHPALTRPHRTTPEGT